MLERLVEFIIDILGAFVFWAILQPYERGVLIRLGSFKRTLGPGIHWVIPFYIDNVETDNVVPTTSNLLAQSLQTRDGVAVVVSVVITYAIRDIKKVLLEVENADDVLADSTYALVGRAISNSNYDDICRPEFAESIFKEIRRAAFSWGIEVRNIGFADLAKAKSLRLWMESGDG